MASSTLKRKSSETDDAYPNDGMQTPTGSPSRKKMRFTRKQKQALIDNLQLEITERARKLRAQYALQTHDLRARIERRVNRIPVALRKAKMGDLLEKHNASLRAHHSPRKVTSPAKRNITNTTAGASARRVRKLSPEGPYFDKENAPTGESLDVLNNPKKRGKPAAAGGPSRVVSQEVRGADYRILSPKSLNSRTYPQSPFRASPEKSQQPGYMSKPMSPLKRSSPLRAAASLSGANGATATKDGRLTSQTARPASKVAPGTKGIRSPLPRPATRQRERRNSASSNASSGTTIVKPTKTGTGARKATNTSSTTTTGAKKTATARNQVPSSTTKKTNTATATAGKRAPTPASEAQAAGRRALRKRL
ncbi:uncharacterized protein EURHEDRAFT_527198 [Aspergillus ruber CBS 135680]|uniref:Borealin N-terminal domain-containing protein n=1 Tax=Aspergillus ruber (strain CBS 135680) TaxID=1388766 RepID=A0A017S0P7_ASPRC|nr:uncharacterized protein EURHEDRAFT_527198 [Aspergillus ruber CBS 135680]EYE90199.1 hypothetical protein EURHEDRAFT_527198 [Aspergillus ruber CBS 135680]